MKLTTTLLTFLCLTIALWADNSISIREDSRYGQVVNGYIDEAVLVVDLHGAYAEQSLYITYSDHGEIGNSKWSEITHRFELPEKATVTDMWLWIGDSVMQATIEEVSLTQAMYDSITSQKSKTST